jgi:hypothetical protein
MTALIQHFVAALNNVYILAYVSMERSSIQITVITILNAFQDVAMLENALIFLNVMKNVSQT